MILISILIVFIFALGGCLYIYELTEDLEYRYPNPNKRRLLCFLCGPIAWMVCIFIFVFKIIIYISKITIIPLLHWLRDENNENFDEN